MQVPTLSIPRKKSGVGGFHLLSPTGVEEWLCWVNAHWSNFVLSGPNLAPLPVSNQSLMQHPENSKYRAYLSVFCFPQREAGNWKFSLNHAPLSLEKGYGKWVPYMFPIQLASMQLVPQSPKMHMPLYWIYTFLIWTLCLCIVEPMSPWEKEWLSRTSYSCILLTGKLLFSDYLISLWFISPDNIYLPYSQY